MEDLSGGDADNRVAGSESAGSPNQALIAILETDFAPSAPAEELPILGDHIGGVIGQIMAASGRPNWEEAEARYRSPVGAYHERKAATMLEDAQITATFKYIISDEVRQAYAERRRVSQEVSPEQLGITDGAEGIFDPEQAPEIEARFMQNRLRDIIDRHLRTPDINSVRILRSSEFSQAVKELSRWLSDYQAKFQRSPFDDSILDAFIKTSKISEYLL